MPVAGTPQDAYRCLLESDIDILVLENCVVYKDQLTEPSGLGGAQRATVLSAAAA